jgi:hypothetical protein
MRVMLIPASARERKTLTCAVKLHKRGSNRKPILAARPRVAGHYHLWLADLTYSN